jgi:hypothetical protein
MTLDLRSFKTYSLERELESSDDSLRAYFE